MRYPNPCGRIVVLDIETEPDPFAVAIAPRGGPANRPTLHRLSGFSIFAATESNDREWIDLALESGDDGDEYELLFALDAVLTREQERGATLCTYNGIAHDLPVIERRMIANWLFALPGLQELQIMRHRDLMREVTKGYRSTWPSLQDLSAAYGIPTDHLLIPRNGPGRSLPVRKSQVDVIATFLLLAHDLSSKRAQSLTVSRAWLALSQYLPKHHPRQPHLGQFTNHPMVERSRVEARPDPDTM